MEQLLWKITWRFVRVTYGGTIRASNPLPALHPKERTAGIQTKARTQTSVAAIFIIAKRQKERGCPAVDEQTGLAVQWQVTEP